MSSRGKRDELPIEELRARKRHQFEEARARGALTRLALIARELGREGKLKAES